ncbi:MAG TPA: hypothetical protein DCG57_19100 [Candidatus Riflebacteria bacterium]|jgi:hypothetical protein|nr:hypothetical protein [Candidatus Riflebacteria bacterium]
MTAKHYLLILAFVLVLPGLFACSLPAEPCAAIVPINSTAKGMKLVPDGTNRFFYLVPQGTSASFKVVWDPAAHNTGTSLKTDKYDWCTKARIANEPNTDRPGGYGYFPIQSMADFFSVSGNRGSIQEAFSREMGVSTGDAFMPSVTGAFDMLSTFVKSGNQGRITTLGGQSNEYPAPGIADIVAMDNAPLTQAQDENYPDSSWNRTTVKTDSTANPATTKIYLPTVNATKGVRIFLAGLLIEGMDMQVTTIRPSDYKAFIRTGNDAASIEVESNPQIVWSADGSNGTPGPDFNVTFNTPSLCNKTDLTQSKIRLKVWSPGAGFEISNVYWAWQETVYEKTSRVVVTQEEVRNASDVVIVPRLTETREFWERGASYKCSEELQIKLIKSAAEAGSTDFIVYDDKSPIASDFKLTSSDLNFKAAGPTTLDFSLKVLDTNPYFNQLFTKTIDNKTFIQSLENLDINVYYSYPHYDYDAIQNLTIDNLRNVGYGIADKQDLVAAGDPKFKSFTHKSEWFWKKAIVPISSLEIGPTQLLTGGTGKRAGSACTIKGKLTIQQPRPWHECNAGNGISEPVPQFKVFAISADTAGKKLEDHDNVKDGIGESAKLDTAKPDLSALPVACLPGSGGPIPPGDTRGQVHDDSIDDSRWSNIATFTAKDEVGPEIQVIVFDTRTNRYHMFGTKKNVAAGYSQFGGATMVEDYSTGDIPYQPDQKTGIDNAHKFNDLSSIDDLFKKYLVGPDAVSTIEADSQEGFVCQQNNRLVFYIRAVDNINSYLKTKNFGISNITCSLRDKNGDVTGIDWPTPANMLKPIEHVFRYENVDGDGNIGDEYYLQVTATDHSINSRTFKLNFAVLGRKLDIRTLEERRKRID